MIREAAARQDPFPLVILDMCMPTMDGAQTAEAIRAERSLTPPSLLLLTSGLLPLEPLVSKLGITQSLEKPVGQSKLYNALLSCFRPSVVAPASDVQGARETRRTQRPRVLVAEDNEVNLEIATLMLSTMGCDVDVAVNGRRAVEMWSASRYDLILMDCQMPELDGYAATRIIRQHERFRVSNLDASADGRIPVIALTAHAIHGDRERCLVAGMDDYLSKPFTISRLTNMVDRWLSASPLPTSEETSNLEPTIQ